MIPKEAFLYDDTSGHILIANIASPNSVASIQSHRKVCMSFIDVFTQKGFKIKGSVQNIQEGHEAYECKR